MSWHTLFGIKTSWWIWNSNSFLSDIITYPCPNFNDCLPKPPLNSGHRWVIIYHNFIEHYDDVMLASQITSLTVVYSIVYSGVNQRKHQSSASLAFAREIHRGPVNFPHKWPVTRKMFPFDDVIMGYRYIGLDGTKPLPEPMPINYQWCLVAYTCRQFHMKWPRYLAFILVWKFTNLWLKRDHPGQWVKDFQTHNNGIIKPIIGSDNGLSPGWHQAIIWTNAGIWSLRPLGINFSEILLSIQTFSSA